MGMNSILPLMLMLTFDVFWRVEDSHRISMSCPISVQHMYRIICQTMQLKSKEGKASFQIDHVSSPNVRALWLRW